ncbi:hypothetical protein BBJ28_00008550 [Nothophytophthora sp. Chile5]|nr:hypothetical protein BBJ28_00008550 [Nothophytophthora sp. Chile5]
MDAATSSARSRRRRVAFEGAEVIEYDADLPSAVRLCGAGRSAASGSGSNSPSLALECAARGLELSAADDEDAARQALVQQYVRELQSLLRQRGFVPVSDDLQELVTQRRVAELLLAWTAGAEAAAEVEVDRKAGGWNTASLLDPQTLRRVQLAKKQLEGRVDDGYVFGRRFFSVSSYVDTLSSDELLATANARGLEVPALDAQQRAAVKAADRELLGQHGTAEGRPLRALTLRQLVTEAEARGLDGPGGESARDSKGKRSKRAWVDVLRPLMRVEVRAQKIREAEELLLRKLLCQELEQQMQREQHEQLTQLIQKCLDQASGSASSDRETIEPEAEATVSSETREGDNSTASQETEKAREYLAMLATTLCLPSEPDGDTVMKE